MLHNQASLGLEGFDTFLLRAKSLQSVTTPIRPIHYLGSKLRIVDIVREIVDVVDPSGGTVCDLFAGSGTVSRQFSLSRNVIAVDIQEYSRVLCSALLNPARLAGDRVQELLDKAYTSSHAKSLSWAIEPLVNHEATCLKMAETGAVEDLCLMLEQAPLILYQLDPLRVTDHKLRAAMSETVARLREAELADSAASMTTRYFGGIYFSYWQAMQIDMLLEAISTFPPTFKDTLLAAVLSTASETVNSVGKQFAQPIRPRDSGGRPKPELAARVARDRNIDVPTTFTSWITRYLALSRPAHDHRVIRGDYLDTLDLLINKVSVVYADPPYTRDHYSRFYHVLETICLRDCPPLSRVRTNGADHISRGTYRKDRHQSPFCIKSKAPYAFSALFEGVRRLNVPLVVSYSPFENTTRARPRLMTINQIVELARKCFASVEVVPAGWIAHSKLNRSDLNTEVTYGAEKFITCVP